MSEYHIWGGNPLFGETRIQGSKNAVLPIMAASLLIKGISIIENCPKITDVYHMQSLLQKLGCSVTWRRNTLCIDATDVALGEMDGESVTGMRSSLMLLGALLARNGQVSMMYPGGCVIGKRPIDFHLNALAQMGVEIQEEEQGFHAQVKQLKGANIHLPFPSVGATENSILCAVCATGVTVLHNVAREPEIVALCEFLKQAGAIIEGIGEATLLIKGMEQLHEVTYRVPADRIVAGTYLFSVLGTGGHILLQEAPVQQMRSLLQVAVKMGAVIHHSGQGLSVIVEGTGSGIPYVKTGVYPGFPTDMQSPLIAALCKREGQSIIEETILKTVSESYRNW